ncbi:hypothetical protein F5J12DRAFT_502347 [Pisolithus orientalis]|uniref:uncharacterized protein n=1 Tax=Pisolithus orientalis TaxID=936130 RepID=UPI002223F96D|nr:uncharacterized protein F5J12DRAFT_502347 [Pisolithus orientalis]KAI5989821.1 hypothetical protein F5J12DRAFT_502347 [Pisolithus orientalis]
MPLYNRIILRKLRRLLHRVLRLLKMVSEAPKIEGLFDEESYGLVNVRGWYSVIRNNPLTSDCQVIRVGWYKMRKGVEHEFLRFDISSPDNQHTSIIIAERSGGVRNPNYDPPQTADTHLPADTVVDATASPPTPPETSARSPDVGDSTASSADESGPPLDKVTKRNRKKMKKLHTAQIAASLSSSSERDACDRVYFATRISAAGARVEEMCDKPQRLCTLRFTGAKPTANELATLLYVTSTQEPKYAIARTQCYWFAATVFDALKMLYKGAMQDNRTHRGGTICGVPVAIKASGEEVCAKYREARAALAEEIEQERRLKQEQEEERQREREQREAAEERARAAEEERQREREQRQAAEEERQREREQRQAAEEERQREREQRQAAEEERQREREQRQAAEEANAKLLQELEALKRAVASAQQA